ncbi:hypothetical protein ACFY7Y_32430 [Streptomyces virginiae]|uniref:hypothetical protein n=1 Tax=Streptomyces virginiae TaxID=1961 RepID=UPI00131B5CE1|nr:hypothetical protein [Streptomyces virginiae]
MAVASLTPQQKISLALAAQNFRPVNLDSLTQPASMNLASVPDDLESALLGVRRTATSWPRIGEQLAVLRDGLNADGRYLLDVHIGAKSQAVKVVVTCGFSGTPLLDQQFRRHRDFTWVVMQSLEGHIRQFEIQPELLALLDAARSKYAAFTDPIIKAAVDLAWAWVSMSGASGGPLAVYIAECFAGVSPELASALRSNKYTSTQAGFGNQPTLEGLAWDCRQVPFSDESLYYGMLQNIDDVRLKQTLRL